MVVGMPTVGMFYSLNKHAIDLSISLAKCWGKGKYVGETRILLTGPLVKAVI